MSASSPKFYAKHTPVRSRARHDYLRLTGRLGRSRFKRGPIGHEHDLAYHASLPEQLLRLSRLANGVAELHGETAREMWKDVEGAAPIISITNGVHAPTWQDARIRAALRNTEKAA